MSKFADSLKEIRLWAFSVGSVLVAVGGGTAINANVSEDKAEQAEERAGNATELTIKKLNAHSKVLKQMQEDQEECFAETDELHKAMATLQKEVKKYHTRAPIVIIEEHEDPAPADPAPPPPTKEAKAEKKAVEVAAEDAFAEMPADYGMLQKQLQEKLEPMPPLEEMEAAAEEKGE